MLTFSSCLFVSRMLPIAPITSIVFPPPPLSLWLALHCYIQFGWLNHQWKYRSIDNSRHRVRGTRYRLSHASEPRTKRNESNEYSYNFNLQYALSVTWGSKVINWTYRCIADVVDTFIGLKETNRLNVLSTPQLLSFSLLVGHRPHVGREPIFEDWLSE